MSTYWLKPEDDVPDAGFRPLEELAALVATDPSLPTIEPDHFLYAATVERPGFPTLRIYRHVGTRKLLSVDDLGDLWWYTGSDRVGANRYAPFDSIPAALDAADLIRGNLVVGHLRATTRPANPTPASTAPAPVDGVGTGPVDDDASKATAPSVVANDSVVAAAESAAA